MGDVCLGSPVACQRLKIAQTALPLFASESRLMLITPHPDDEALACALFCSAPSVPMPPFVSFMPYASFEVTAFRKTAAADDRNAFCFGSRSDGNDPV
jgi:hypothetical protein